MEVDGMGYIEYKSELTCMIWVFYCTICVNRLFARIQAPFLINTNGMIAMANEKKPSSELAQSIPSLAYMAFVAIGRKTAKIDRDVLAAAAAEAENCLYASVR
jgi:hypothetical protein